MILGRLFSPGVRARRGRGCDLQCCARRPLSRRAEPRAVPALHRAPAAADDRDAGRCAHRLPDGETCQARRSGLCRPMPPRTPRWIKPGGGSPAVITALRRKSSTRVASFLCRARRRAWRAFRLADLCECPLGALDYLKLAHEFHTLDQSCPLHGFSTTQPGQAVHHPDRHAV